MSILSTNTRLIKVGQDYSAGSGISIDDYIISVTSVPGTTYSAGDNITIEDNVINSKDWSQDIADASANAYNEATAQIPAPFDPSYISGQIDNKLDTTAFTNWQDGQYTTDIQTIEGQISNKLDTSSFSDVSASFLTAINIPESATWQDVSTTVQSNSAQWSDNTGDEEVNSFVYDNSATILDVDTTYQQNSATYLTAHQDVSNKLDTTAFSTVSGEFLTAAPTDMATTGDLAELAQTVSETYQVKGDYLTTADSANFYPANNPSSFTTEDWVTAQGYITGVDLSEYAKRDFVLSSIESANSGKLDVSSFASVSSDFIVASSLEGYATESFVENVSGEITALIPDTSNFITNTSAEVTYQTIDGMTAYQPVGDYYSASNPSGFITGVDLTPYYTTAAANTLSSMFSGAIDYVSSNAGNQEVSNVVQSNSSTWNNVTAKQNTLTFRYGTSSGSITSINGSAIVDDYTYHMLNVTRNYTASMNKVLTANSAKWNQVTAKLNTTAFSTVSGDFLTAHQSLDGYATEDWITSQGYITGVEIPESATWNEVSTAYQNTSATYLTAHQDLSDYQTIAGMTAYQPVGDYYSASNPSGFIVSNDLNAYVRKDTRWLEIGEDNYVETYNTATQNMLYDSFAFGYKNSASNMSVSFGSTNTSNNYSLAQGNRNSAYRNSFSLGINNYASGTNGANGSFAQGFKNSAYSGSFAQGSYNVASGYSFAQGGRGSYTNSAIDHSLAQGSRIVVSGYSLAQGDQCMATAYSIAQGAGAIASYYSQAFGKGTIASSSGMAIGTYNATDSAAFVIGNGNGAGANSRSDAFIVYHDGSVSAAGKISANGVELGAGGEFPISADEAIQYVQTNSAGIEDTITNVTTNSGAWGGSALSLSAGPGIGLSMVDGVLVISVTGGN